MADPWHSDLVHAAVHRLFMRVLHCAMGQAQAICAPLGPRRIDLANCHRPAHGFGAVERHSTRDMQHDQPASYAAEPIRPASICG